MRPAIKPSRAAFGLVGCRVLVVEDDYVIAIDTVGMLEDAGAVPVGPVGWVAEALATASDPAVELDLAILDLDLHGTPSYPVADALAARGVPFVFTTGFSPDLIEPAYRGLVRLEKPVSAHALLRALHAKT